MITIYDPHATDFGGNGLGILQPTECTILEEAGGRYELTLKHPIDETLRWAQISVGCVIKAPAPLRETPLYEITAFDGVEETTTTVTRKLYAVRTNGGRLRLRARPNTSSAILGMYRPDTEVLRLADAGNNWYQVSVVSGGAVGYMYAGWLRYVRDVTETVTENRPVTRKGVKIIPSRDQLFRVSKVERDTEQGIVTATALQIFYDLRTEAVDDTYKPEGVSVADACQFVMSNLLPRHNNPGHGHETPFTIDVSNISGTISGDYSYKSPVEILLDPDDGIVAQTHAQIFRDNYNVYLLPDDTRDMGVTIRRGKNLVGVTVTSDGSNVVTRIVPVGSDDGNGNPLFLIPAIAQEYGSDENYIDSPEHISDYSSPRVKRIDYEVSVVSSDPDNITTFTDINAARRKLASLALEDFNTNGADLPTYEMEVDFVLLGDVEGYQDYASLQAVHLYDTVTVIDELIGLESKIRVTGYTWDCLTEQYESVTLGKLESVSQMVYSYQMPNAGISGSKIAGDGRLDGKAIRSETFQYASISQAAIGQLNANSINAVAAHIAEITAQTITTDTLAAALAHVAELVAGTIQATSGEFDALTAAVAKLARAEIESAALQNADIQALKAAIANVATAYIDWATIISANIGSASIDYAQIKYGNVGRLIADDAVEGRVLIERLQVLSAQLARATIGELVVKAADDHYYRLDVSAGGAVTATDVTADLTEAEINAGVTSDGRGSIIETSLTVEDLAAGDLKAINALIDHITADRIDADVLFAREGTINKLNTQIIEAIDATDLAGRNLIINTLSPDVSSAEKYPRLRGQTYASESGSSTTEISTAEHGVRLTENARTGYIELRFGTPRSGYRSLNGLTPGETYTLAWDYVYSSSGRLNYISARLCDDTVETGSPRIDQEVEWEISSEEAAHCKFTFTVPANVTMLYLTIRASSVYIEAGDYLELRNLTLVRGEAGEAWSPAPEDTQNGIETNRANITLNTQQIESTVERVSQTEGNVEALSTQLTQTAEDLTATLSQKVNASDVEAWARYSVSGGEGTLELGQKGSRYTTETSPTGFRVKQDGQNMTTMVRGRVASPVFEVKRQIEIGNYSVRADAEGGVLFI